MPKFKKLFQGPASRERGELKEAIDMLRWFSTHASEDLRSEEMTGSRLIPYYYGIKAFDVFARPEGTQFHDKVTWAYVMWRVMKELRNFERFEKSIYSRIDHYYEPHRFQGFLVSRDAVIAMRHYNAALFFDSLDTGARHAERLYQFVCFGALKTKVIRRLTQRGDFVAFPQPEPKPEPKQQEEEAENTAEEHVWGQRKVTNLEVDRYLISLKEAWQRKKDEEEEQKTLKRRAKRGDGKPVPDSPISESATKEVPDLEGENVSDYILNVAYQPLERPDVSNHAETSPTA
ncbi:hypothetical protein MKZ38_002716 [Zalerion maritima]|uniref:Uncharacterized protein n=1 Tax=Zalerion maritima TaxID=339359 RepID=A0AAD5RNN9_9PEZI|nr:hypothetical protein MKZ38_002716 [Zalerion maritima]